MSDDLQQQVQEAIDGMVASGTETGLQAAVYRRGERIVNAVAGEFESPVLARVLVPGDQDGRNRR